MFYSYYRCLGYVSLLLVSTSFHFNVIVKMYYQAALRSYIPIFTCMLLPKRNPINVNASTRWRLTSPREAFNRLLGNFDMETHAFPRFHLNPVAGHKRPRRPFKRLIEDYGTFVFFIVALLTVLWLSGTCIMTAFYAFTFA